MTLITKPGFLWNETIWNPSMIQTALWLDAADVSTITASGSDLTQINDKSGNARNFTSASGTRPTSGTASLNGKNVLSFSGSYLTSAFTAATWNFLHNATGSSVFAVATFGTSSDPNAVYGLAGTNAGSTSSNVGMGIFFDDRASVPRNNALLHQIGRGGGYNPVAAQLIQNFVTPNSATIVSVLGDPSNATVADRSIASLNGGTTQKTNTDNQTLSTADAAFVLQIGAGGNNFAPLTGSLAEFVIVSGVASLNTRQRIEGYLAHKWGLEASLPSDHPYKTTGPTP